MVIVAVETSDTEEPITPPVLLVNADVDALEMGEVEVVVDDEEEDVVDEVTTEMLLESLVVVVVVVLVELLSIGK